MSRINPKTYLLEHSEAKVKLYGRYLSEYLRVLYQARFVKRVFIFDLFCGEGVYQNGEKGGSPIIAIENIASHYHENNGKSLDITVWFNDFGKSEIESGLYKVERVEKIISKMFIPSNIKIEYYKKDFRDIYPDAINLLNRTKDSKGLFFIDPFGYKMIKPNDLRRMLENRNAEVLLWLPTAQMYRFAGSLSTGVEPLHDFLTEIFGGNIPQFASDYDFINQLRTKFQEYLSDLKVFANTFTLERDTTNVYCLFFFTTHIKGYEKILAAKWDMDKEHGKGFKLEKTPTLFSEIELSGYDQKLRKYLESGHRTNIDLYLFGLKNDFLPKHTKSVLDNWKKGNIHFDVIAQDNQPVRGYYIEYNSKRKVVFSIDNGK
jgi:three-Cys-motif partner protein